MPKPQLTKVKGLAEFLSTLALLDARTPGDGHVSVAVYPSYKYSKDPKREVSVTYSPAGIKLATVRKILCESLENGGHMATDRFADALLLAYVLMSKTSDPISELERLLATMCHSQLSQLLVIPAPSILRIIDPIGSIGDAKKHLLVSFGLGPFEYAPFYGSVCESVKRKLRRAGVNHFIEELASLVGQIALIRKPRKIRVIDFHAIGLTGQRFEEHALLNYYFDDLADAFFEEFWLDHAESQLHLVASGATVLDRATLESLPGTTWLSIFLGFNFGSQKGTASLIQEESHRRDTVGARIYDHGQALLEARLSREFELPSVGRRPYIVIYASLQSFARTVSRSRELSLRGYPDQAFVLLMVAVESLVADRASIGDSIARRVGVLVAIAEKSRFFDAKKELAELYDSRSQFVHESRAVPPDALPRLEVIARTVYFAAWRSQLQDRSRDPLAWKRRWLVNLDYLASCATSGVRMDSAILTQTGARSTRKRTSKVSGVRSKRIKLPTG